MMNRKLVDNNLRGIWLRLYDEPIFNPNVSIVEKTKTIQKDEVKTIKLDDGTFKNNTQFFLFMFSRAK